MYPKKLKKLYGLSDDSRVYWLSDSSSEPDTLVPTRLDFEITRIINKFVKDNDESILLLDGFAYLTLENEYDKVRKFIKRTNDLASMNGGTIVVVVNPNSFNKETITTLSRDFDKVGVIEEFTGDASASAPAPEPMPISHQPTAPAAVTTPTAKPQDLRIDAPPEIAVPTPPEEVADELPELEIEDIYLIHRSTGTLIQRRTWRDQDLIDPDLIGGMFQAILDFINNSFATGEQSEFSRIDVKGYIILIADGGDVSLAMVFSGKVEEYLHKAMNDIKKALKSNISNIEKQYLKILSNYDGDVSKLRGTRKHLDALSMDINKALEAHLAGKPIKRRLSQTEKQQVSEKFNMAISSGRQKKYEEAIGFYNAALEIAPAHIESLFNKGVILQMLGRVDEALDCYNQVIELNPNDPEIWGNRGIALRTLGRVEDAIDSYDQGLRINPADASLWSNKGIALRSTGRIKEAIECYDKALEVNPRDAGVWSNKGVVLGSMGLLKEAIECYDKALALDPGRRLASKNREIALKELERRNSGT
jgi:tetratricopeptide (TPR) repeat protein